MLIYLKKITAVLVGVFFMTQAQAQCETWNDSPQKDDAESAHSVYRQALKSEDYDMAFENWQKAYDIAPAADGKRDYHYVDGAALYLNKFKNETDADKKKEYAAKAIGLWDQAIDCYGQGALNPSSCKGIENCHDKKIGFVSGRKAYDMFYIFNSPYAATLEALDLSIEKSGDDIEYIVFDPAATIVVYQFQNEKMDAETARSWYERLHAGADKGIAKGGQFQEYFQNAKTAIDVKFRAIEKEIFDCEFFKNKYEEEFRENSSDPKTVKRILQTLVSQGCPESDPLVMEIDKVWKKYAAAENARIQKEFEANNPAVAAKSLYDQGDFKGAIAKYDLAISQESDPVKKAEYQFRKASVQFRKLKSYGAARATAREAAKTRSGWGRPYMLIGDMYASTARSCGDAWNQRLAIIAAIDKYNYAKSIDPEVASEAGSRVSKYRSSLPEKQQGFMRGVKAGSSQTVGCWIGESVKVRFK